MDELPPQCTFWRFLASLHLGVARQLFTVHKRVRERVCAAANVQLDTLTVDTDTTAHTLFGHQMRANKSYNFLLIGYLLMLIGTSIRRSIGHRLFLDISFKANINAHVNSRTIRL